MTGVSAIKDKMRVASWILLVFLVAQGCALFHSGEKEWYPVRGISHNVEINSSIKPDSAMAAEVQTYRKILNKDLGKKIGYAEAAFKTQGIESGLYNLVADALRIQISLSLGKHIDMAIMSPSSVRYYIPKGPITPELIDEILPYVNKVVLMKLTGKQVTELANDIAVDGGGVPVSGLRMLITQPTGTASELLVGQYIVEPDSIYTIATSQYLADGGGHYSVLWKPNRRKVLKMTTRDALQSYIEDRGRVSPVLDGRIRK